MKKITTFLLMLLIFGIFSCSSFDSKKLTKEFIMKNLLAFYIENQDSVFFYFVLNSSLPIELDEKIPAVEYTKLYFKGQSEDSAIYPQEIMNSFYRTSEKNINITFVYSQKFSKNQLQSNWKSQKVNFVLNTNSGKYTIEKSIEDMNPANIFPEIQALYLLPAMKINNGLYNFQLLAIRLNSVQGSYLPSSERMRVEIENDKVIYNSSEGKNFMQVISDVFPVEIGDYYVYEESVDFASEKIKYKGSHKAKLIIPAMPINYVSTIDFWNN